MHISGFSEMEGKYFRLDYFGGVGALLSFVYYSSNFKVGGPSPPE